MAKVVENGLVVAGAPTTISMIALNFTANGGDGYPIKGTANGSNYRFVLNDGTLSAPVSESLDFTAAGVVPANALGEQKAFEDYLRSRHERRLRPTTLPTRLPRVTSGSRTSRPAPTQSSTPRHRCSRSRATSRRTPRARRVPPSNSACRRRIPSKAVAPSAARSRARWVRRWSLRRRCSAIGTTTVTCTASDLAGNTSTRSFAVTVVGSAGQIEALQGKVGSLPSLQQTKKDAKTIAKLNEELEGPEQEEAA